MSPDENEPLGRPTNPDGLAGRRRDTAVARAAATIAAATGRPHTVVDVLHGRAFRRHASALEAYLVLRYADVERGRRALREVRARLATLDADTLTRPPGIRAQIFRVGRRHVHETRPLASTERALARSELPWAREPAEGRPAAHLEALRTGLSDHDLEMLELRFGRDFSPDEIACVLDVPIEEVYSRLSAATQRALDRIDRTEDPAGLRVLLRDALELSLAVEPSRSGDEDTWEGLSPGTVIGERYFVEKRVGGGAFGDVYRASDRDVADHVVALKLLHQAAREPEARELSLRELRLIASVFHPSIVQFKDHGWHEDRLWFVMPWYDGETLEDRIRRRPLTRLEALRIFQPLARALATMHASGIRHQDVKPENIFLARVQGFGVDEELPVLLDLGVAAKEAEMVVAGTPTYFAPEVAAQFCAHEPKPPVTTKADVFSLTLALRNALDPETEEHPAAADVERFIARRAVEVPPPPSQKDLRYLDPFWKRFLAPNPADRPDANDLAVALDVLELPEQRRVRRRAAMSIAIPLIVAAASIVTAVSVSLSAKVEAEARESARIQQQADGLRVDLTTTQRNRERLERAMQQAEQRLEEGELTMAELERLLTSTRHELSRESSRVEAVHARAEQLRAELTAAQARETTLERRLADAVAEGSRERERAVRVEDRLTATSAELGRVEDGLRSAQAQIRTLDARVADLDGRLSAERARAESLQVSLSNALSESSRLAHARSEADAELARALRRIRELEGGGGRGDGGGGTEPAPTP